MRNSAGITAQLPAPKIFGEKVPANTSKPFSRYGMPLSDAFWMQGLDGAEEDVTIHTFADGETIDAISPLNNAIVEDLHDASLVLGEGWCLDLTFVQCQVIRDPDESLHGIIRFSALTGVAS